MKIIREGILFIIFMQAFSCLQLNPSPNNQTCPFAHFSSGSGQCTQCSAYCPSCTNSSNQCNNCTQGLFFDRFNKVCQNCDIGESDCEPLTNKNNFNCFPYFIKQKNICKPQCLVANCKDCFLGYCITCVQGFKLSEDNTTCAVTQGNIKISQIRDQKENCSLKEYFSESTQKCQKCNERCISCINFSNKCTVCQRRYFKNGWKCLTLSYLLVNLDLIAVQQKSKGGEQLKSLTSAEQINKFKMLLMQMLKKAKDNRARYGPENFTLGRLVMDMDKATNISLFKMQFFLDAEQNLWPIKQMMIFLGQILKNNQKIGGFTIKSSNIQNSKGLNYEQQQKNIISQDWSKIPAIKNKPTEKKETQQEKDSFFLIIVLIIASVILLIGLVFLIFVICWCKKRDFDEKQGIQEINPKQEGKQRKMEPQKGLQIFSRSKSKDEDKNSYNMGNQSIMKEKKKEIHNEDQSGESPQKKVSWPLNISPQKNQVVIQQQENHQNQEDFLNSSRKMVHLPENS